MAKPPLRDRAHLDHSDCLKPLDINIALPQVGARGRVSMLDPERYGGIDVRHVLPTE